MAENRTLLLGLGAQKAGTTWVYRYLRDHPQCATGTIKELAVLGFHAEHAPSNPGRNATSLKRIAAACDVIREKGPVKLEESIDIVLDQSHVLAARRDLSLYYKYFERQFELNPQARVAIDITPEYGDLTRETLAKVKQSAEAAGYRIKVLFMVRDPVERCYSSARMRYRNTVKAAGGVKEGVSSPAKAFDKAATSKRFETRTRYERIIPHIEAVFAPENRMILPYEEVLTAQGTADLCRFVGVEHQPSEPDKVVNSTKRDHDPDPETWRAVQAFYAETYRFCKDRFGAERLAALGWGEVPGA